MFIVDEATSVVRFKNNAAKRINKRLSSDSNMGILSADQKSIALKGIDLQLIDYKTLKSEEIETTLRYLLAVQEKGEYLTMR